MSLNTYTPNNFFIKKSIFSVHPLTGLTIHPTAFLAILPIRQTLI